jgi:hypothetical protein
LAPFNPWEAPHKKSGGFPFTHEFFGPCSVQCAMSFEAHSQRTGRKLRLSSHHVVGEGQFFFGARRYHSTGPRRLFVPQKGLMSPVFEAEVDPPRTILRVVSSCS